MPKIPVLGGESVTPLGRSVPTATIDQNALGAINRSNAQIAEAVSGLGQKLLERGKGLQIQEETSQARSDYELKVREGTTELQRRFNESGDYKNYSTEYNNMLGNLSDQYKDQFNWTESEVAFSSFRRNYDNRQLANADVFQTSQVTKSLIKTRQNTFQNDMRAVEISPISSDASLKLMQHTSSLDNINKEGGFFTPDQLEQEKDLAHKQTFETLMEGYRSRTAPDEALRFLADKGDRDYKNITSRVDGRLVAQWETRFKNMIKSESGIKRRSITFQMNDFKDAAVKGSISIDGENRLQQMKNQIASSDFDDKKELIDEINGIETADAKFKEIQTMTLGQKEEFAQQIKDGKFSFFPKSKGEFNANGRKGDENYYNNALKKDTKLMKTDTANYLVRSDSLISDLAERAENIDDPAAVQEYIHAIRVKMDQLGVPTGKVLTDDLTAQMTDIFNTAQPAIDSIKVDQIRQSWGENTNILFRDLQGKVDNSKLIAVVMPDNDARFLTLSNQGRKPEIEKLFKERNKGNDNEITASPAYVELFNHQKAADPFGAADRLWRPLLENVALETKRIIGQGEETNINTAADAAKQRIFEANFEAFDGILIPRDTQVSADDVEDFVDDFEDIFEGVVSNDDLENGFNIENTKWMNDPSGISLRGTNSIGRANSRIMSKEGQPIRVDFADIANGSFRQKLADLIKGRNKKTSAELQKQRPRSGRSF